MKFDIDSDYGLVQMTMKLVSKDTLYIVAKYIGLNYRYRDRYRNRRK